MAVGNIDSDVEGKIREVGEKLESPPESADGLLPLLDQLETLLTRVEQSPSPSMLASLQPAMSALITEKLLAHADADVRVAVAACVSEVTRITAPDAPYSDESMKEIFKSIVESFEKLDDLASRSFQKRVSILETVSKVRSCVVMLDLECDDLILEMFRHFLKAISLKHHEHIFNSMETIMTLVIEESEEISPELATILLNSVKKERKDMVPVSFKLGEKVIRNCAERLKPALKEVAQHDLNSYSKYIVSLCGDGSEALEEQSDVEVSAKNAAEESKMSDRTVSDELLQGSAKADEEQEVGCTEEVGSAAPNGEAPSSPVPTGNGESNVVEPSSPKQKAERPCTKKAPKAESSSQKEPDAPAGEPDKREENQPAKQTESSGSQEVLSDKKKEEPSGPQPSNNGEKKAETPVLPDSSARPKRGRPSAKKGEEVKKDVAEGASDSEGKSLRQSKRKGGVTVGDAKQKPSGGKKKSEKDEGGVNEDISLKEMITPKAAEKMAEAGGSKRKRAQEKEKVTEGKKPRNMDDSIVGARIKVWWPDDQAFYNGVIDQYDPSDKRHTIVYDDGDVEVLLLKNEKWDFVEDEANEHSNPDTRGDTSQSKKAKTGSASQSNKKEAPKTSTKGSVKSKGKDAPIETPKSKEPAGKSSQKPKSNGSSTTDKSGKRKAGRS